MRLGYIILTYVCGVFMGLLVSEFNHDKYTDALLLEFKHEHKAQLDACNKHWKQAIIDAELE